MMGFIGFTVGFIGFLMHQLIDVIAEYVDQNLSSPCNIISNLLKDFLKV